MLKLGVKDYEVKYPFAACRELEKASGKSITTFLAGIYAGFSDNSISFDDITLLIWGGILHARRGVTIDQVAEMLDNTEKPLLNIVLECAAVLQESLAGKLRYDAPETEEADEADEKN